MTPKETPPLDHQQPGIHNSALPTNGKPATGTRVDGGKPDRKHLIFLPALPVFSIGFLLVLVLLRVNAPNVISLQLKS